MMRLNKPSLRVDSVAFLARDHEVTERLPRPEWDKVFGADRLAFRVNAPAVVTDKKVSFSRRVSIDDTGSENVDAVATSEPIGDFQDAVGGFGEGVRQPGVEVGE